MINKIKTICGIKDNKEDALIESMIVLYEIPLKKTIKEEFISNIFTYPIIETGICEIIAGHVLNAIDRNNCEEISLSSFTCKSRSVKGDNLIKQGYEKLSVFTKDYKEINISSGILEE